MSIRGVLLLPLLLAACAGNPAAPEGTGATTALLGTGQGVTVFVDGVLWGLPRAACTGEDAAATATATAHVVQALVAGRAAGWPTTTAALPGEEASFFVDINRAGPSALAMATIAGTLDTVVAQWSEFEAGYASLPESPGALRVISDRLPGWMATADAIVSELPAACG